MSQETLVNMVEKSGHISLLVFILDIFPDFIITNEYSYRIFENFYYLDLSYDKEMEELSWTIDQLLNKGFNFNQDLVDFIISKFIKTSDDLKRAGLKPSQDVYNRLEYTDTDKILTIINTFNVYPDPTFVHELTNDNIIYLLEKSPKEFFEQSVEELLDYRNNPQLLDLVLNLGYIPKPGFLSQANDTLLNGDIYDVIPFYNSIKKLAASDYIFNDDDLNVLVFFQDWDFIDELMTKFDIHLTSYAFELIRDYWDLNLIKILVNKYGLIPEQRFLD